MTEIRNTTNTITSGPLAGEYRGWFVIKNGLAMHFEPFATEAEARVFADRGCRRG